MKFAIFGLFASVDIRLLPGVGPIKSEISYQKYLHAMALKELKSLIYVRYLFEIWNFEKVNKIGIFLYLSLFFKYNY